MTLSFASTGGTTAGKIASTTVLTPSVTPLPANGAETLTAFAAADQAIERIGERAAASIDAQIEGVRVANRLFRWINGGELVGLSAILATGFLLHAQGVVTVGLVTTAALLFHRLFGPVGQVIFGLDDIQRATVGLARLIGVIDLA